jgi:hypothetical protein
VLATLGRLQVKSKEERFDSIYFLFHFCALTPGHRSRLGLVQGFLSAHWSANARRVWFQLSNKQVTPAEIPPTFVHALSVFVSFTPLLSLYKTDGGSVKASWTKKDYALFRNKMKHQIRFYYFLLILSTLQTSISDRYPSRTRPL